VTAKNLEHAQLIDRLGGTYKVRDLIAEKTGRQMTTQAVSMMKRQGIPWHYRHLLADLAKAKRIKVPKNFLVPGA
jgi:hypothetical protein